MRKLEKAIAFTMLKVIGPLRPSLATQIQYAFYRRWGMRFTGRPNYISTHVVMDGTDYSLIAIGEGVTISSYVRILTHDWAAHTVAKAVGLRTQNPLGRISGIEIGDYAFVGTGSIVMPGTKIGRGSIIGAGTVVRGEIPPFSICIGSPAKIVGDSRQYLSRHFVEAEPFAQASLQAEGA